MEAFVGHIVDAPALGEVRGLETPSLVVVEAGRIVEVVRDSSSLEARVAALTMPVTRLGPGEFLFPGFVDVHCHASQFPFAGTGVDRPLMADDGFLVKHAFPTEAKFGDVHLAKQWYGAFLETVVRHGTTTVVLYGSQHALSCDVLVDLALQRRGPRSFVGKVDMDRDVPHPSSVADTERFLQRTRRLNAARRPPLVEAVVTPRFLPTSTPEQLRDLGRLARSHRAPTQTHLSETIDELAASGALYPGKSDAQVLDEAGLLRKPCLLAHAVHLLPGEAQLCASRGAAIAHCPASNFFFAKHALPVRHLLSSGLDVALATDVAGGYSPSMLVAIRYAVLASKTLQFKRDPRSVFYNPGRDDEPRSEDDLRRAHDLSHLDACYLATAAGAKALGLEDCLGTFDVGKTFDAILFTTQPTIPFFGPEGTAEAPRDLFQKIICLGDDRNIRRVYVNGHDLLHPTSSSS